MAASINHPNIVPIYDAGDADGLLYIVMRYVEGADLKALLRREGPLLVPRACMLISQVGGALHAAHECGLIHRDIKPGNILIERIDDGIHVLEHVYLADFGLTKHAQSRSGLTHTGQFVGTVDYVAPEQIEGRPVDKRADVYSLGCVLFECLTGVVPYHRESDVAVLWAPDVKGKSLRFAAQDPRTGTPAAALGHPNGGGLAVIPAAVAAEYAATGRDIYGHGRVTRNILELRAQVEPGDSGGPLILKDGTVGGVVFAEARSDQDVGYALSPISVATDVTPALGRTSAVSTGPCVR